MLVIACTGSFSQIETGYTLSSNLVSNLTEAGYDIESASKDTITTVPQKVYLKRRDKLIEFQVWYKFKQHNITSYCTERVLPYFRFSKCTDKHIKKYIDLELKLLETYND